MDRALRHRALHPEESLESIAEAEGVPKSTLHDRITGTHAPRGVRTNRNLSIAQEGALLDKINAYANRGSLLAPRRITQLAEALCEHPVGCNWTTTFLKRHSDRITSRYWAVQELARLKADTPDTRKTFYTTVKAVFDSHHYAPSNIYNMDEVGFSLSSSRRTRRAGSRTASGKSESILADTVHVTVVAAISVVDAPVPPFLIYKGESLLQEWVSLQDRDPPLMATVTASGYAHSFTHLQWLTDCFDPATRAHANGSSRLRFLDGPDIHTQVDFLEACWARDIIPIILPANLSGIFQPLDVNFFNALKLAYHQQVDDFQLGSTAPGVPKGMFYQWFQRAWATTAYSSVFVAGSELIRSVEEALKVGYRHIDCALIYGNQNEIADGMSKSGVPREEIFLVSKLWNNSHRPELCEADLDTTLTQLQTSYLDAWLIHWPVAFKPGKELEPLEADSKRRALDNDAPGIATTWKEVVRIWKETSQVKAVGVSNFNVEQLETIINATGVVPVINQIECHPSLIQPELFEYCKSKGIVITAYSPLGNNITGKKKVIDQPEIVEIAKRLNKEPAQVLIAWVAKQGFCVIPKSDTPKRIASNFDDFELSDEDFEEISKVGKKHTARANIAAIYGPAIWPINVFNTPEEQEFVKVW